MSCIAPLTGMNCQGLIIAAGLYYIDYVIQSIQFWKTVRFNEFLNKIRSSIETLMELQEEKGFIEDSLLHLIKM